MRKGWLALVLTLALLGCSNSGETASSSPELNLRSSDSELTMTEKAAETQQIEEAQVTQEEEQDGETEEMKLSIDGNDVSVTWENNQAVSDLMALASEGPLNVELSSYGGFEQVGPLGRSLSTSDVRIRIEPGDIVLYAGNQISLFYAPNTWAYTKLGHINNKTADELTELLGNNDVSITITVR